MLARALLSIGLLVLAACVERAIDGSGTQELVASGSPESTPRDAGPASDAARDGGSVGDAGVACGNASCGAGQICCPRSGVQSWACQPAGSSCPWGKPVACDGVEDCAADQLCVGHIEGVADDWRTPRSDPTWTRCWDPDRPFDIKLEICHDDAGCVSGRCELQATPPGAPRLGHCF